jgi:ribonuclease H / adenosylcobalamin/alpha-ribazole phosphatase
MSFSHRDKIKLKNYLLKTLINKEGVISVTLVGSFWEKKNLNNFSDIDIIIILDKFNKQNYDKCISSLIKINLKKFNLGKLKIKINPTFGPLKFDDDNSIVFHTMIYSKKSHINHVIKSPFTCYDWERSNNFKGLSLKEIFPVGKIQLVDFFNSRRGALNYLNNLKNNFISYQKYEFKKSNFILRNKLFKINRRHKFEFSYHLCKFLLINFYKFENQENKIPNKKQLFLLIKKIFKKSYKYYHDSYILLEECKKNKTKNIKINIMKFTKKFINNFISFLSKYKEYDEVIFLRHAKTNLNDGSFLGIGRNPSIINKSKIKTKLKTLSRKRVKILYTSELKRAYETANMIRNKYFFSTDLIEKNYGKAEGLNYYALKNLYPSIIKKWNNNKDQRFPLGENDDDVLKRVKKFKKNFLIKLNKSKKKGISIIVTHNALLRCLIGDDFKTPQYMWYKINIEHITPLNYILRKNKIIPNIDRNVIFKNMIN